MNASIVIPAYNAAGSLPLVLNALCRQDFSDFEVIVVDDASTDSTSTIALEHDGCLDLQVIRSAENIGRARARNLGVEKARGEIIFMLDSDVEVKPDYLSIHLQLHASRERTVGVGVLCYPPELAKRALARYYPRRGGAKLKAGQKMPGKYFISCIASLPRELFNEVGGFNPAFRVYGGEDLELGLRLEASGVFFQFLPAAIGIHHHLRRLNEVVKTIELYGRTGIPLILQHHPKFAADLYLDDLIPGNSRSTMVRLSRRILTSVPVYFPLFQFARLLEFGWLPSPLLTYLHYRSFRKGFEQFQREESQLSAI
ncbi:MAG: glycosyltransferase [bacterium]|nr:glycosyltransferase [bacterium]